MSENISFLSNKVELAENKSNDNLIAKFCLCDFGVNHNGVQLNRETVEPWVSTLVNQPLVGRIGYNGDFTGHNMRVATVTNSEGEKQKEVVFDTEAIGTFVSAGIEEIDGTEYIVGTAEIWRRYPNVCNLIAERVEEGTLHTSWEIVVSESHNEGNVKVIDNGRFTALCALGRNHPPAYDSSQLLEVAESDEDIEFQTAISEDVNNYKEKEDTEMNETIVSEEIEVVIPAEVEEPVVVETPESAENTPETEPVAQSETENVESEEAEVEPEENESAESEVVESEPESAEDAGVEVSALTVRDIFERVGKAVRDRGIEGYIAFLYPEDHIALAHVWDPEYGELDFMQFTYTVNGDEVTVDDGVKIRLEATVLSMSQTIAEKNEALVEASQRIKGLETEVAELKPYKEAADKIEAEKLAAEKQAKITALEQYATKSGFVTSEEISEDGEIKTMIAELDEAGIKQLIADRFMASLQQDKPAEVEVASAKDEAVPQVVLENGDDDAEGNILYVYNNK